MYAQRDKNKRIFSRLQGTERRRALAEALYEGILYGITDLRFGHPTHLECAQALVEAGVSWVQYRGKETPEAQQLEELRRLVPWAQERGVVVVVNDNAHLAKAVGADGLHLGQGDLSPAEARRTLEPHQFLGWSTHNADQARAALREPVDYIGVGPAFATETKPQEPEAGLVYLEWAAREVGLPQVAIGGITEERLESVLATGQKSVAMVAGLLGSEALAQTWARIEARLKA